MPYLGKSPANVPVTAEDIPNNSITAAKIVDGSITIADIGPNAVGNSEMADDAVGVSELSASGTASNTTFLRGDNAWAVVNTNLVADTSPQLGGNLDLNSNNITGTGGIPAANLTGTVAAARLDTATTQAESNDSTKIATTAYVVDKITTLIGGAPSTLNDLNELAAAINDDANYNSTLTTALGTKLPKSGGAMTGAITTNSTFDGVDIATRDGVLTSTTATAVAALPKAGGTMTGNILHNDSVKGLYGTGGDLQIYHDGSHSYISDQGVGNLRILTSNFEVENAANNESMIGALADGSVKLYHNNVLKIETTAAGATVTGTLGATLATAAQPNITSLGTIAAFRSTGIDDNSNALAMTIDSSERIGIGTASPQNPLEVSGNGNYLVRITQTGTNKHMFKTVGNGASMDFLADGANNYVGFNSTTNGDSISFQTNDGNERMRIDSAGDVLIGQTSQTGYAFGQKLVVGDGDNNDGITIQSGATHQGNLAFNHSDGTTAYGRILYQHNTNYMDFFTNNAAKMRIDTNGLITNNSGIFKLGAQTTAAAIGWNFNTSNTTPVSCAQGTAIKIGNVTASGMIVVNDTTITGQACVIVTGGGVVTIIGQTSNHFVSSSSPNSAQYGIYNAGGYVTVKNGKSTAVGLSFMTFRTREGQ